MIPFTLFFLVLFSNGEQFGKDCIYESYFENSDKALTEKYALEDWAKVNTLYKTLINQVDLPRGKDLEEALEVAIKVDDETFCKQIIIKMRKGGLPLSYFLKYRKITTSTYWETFVKDYNELDGNKITYIPELREEFTQLKRRDSLFKANFDQFREGKLKLSKSYLINEATGIYDEFMTLSFNCGFPSEINTGYIERGSFIHNTPVYDLLLRFYLFGEPVIHREFTYEEMVCNGHISQNHYAGLSEIQNNGGDKGIKHTMTQYYNRFK